MQLTDRQEPEKARSQNVCQRAWIYLCRYRGNVSCDRSYMMQNQIDIHDDAAVQKACSKISISIAYSDDGEQQVILNGENVTGLIRTEEVSKMASVTSANPAVRATLLDLQRDLAAKEDVLMDGRDIGTNVLPEAELKIYLTASVETRAERRYKEQIEKGERLHVRRD